MSCREAFFTVFFFCRRSERNPFVLPMQIARRRGDIHSPAGHKARLLFTSNLTQMSIGSVQRRCVGVRRDTVPLREASKAPYVGLPCVASLTFPLQPVLQMYLRTPDPGKSPSLEVTVFLLILSPADIATKSQAFGSGGVSDHAQSHDLLEPPSSPGDDKETGKCSKGGVALGGENIPRPPA